VALLATNATRLVRGRRFGQLPADLRFSGLVAAAAAAVAFLVVRGHQPFAAVLAVTPLAMWLLTRPFVLLVALGASLPDLVSVVGQGSGYHVAVSDLLLVMVTAAILLGTSAERIVETVRALRPVAIAVVPYAVLVLALMPFHLGVGEVAQTLQRYELFVIPLAAGAFAVLRGWQGRVLQAYVVATTVLAIAWPFAHFGMQKNPVGQLFTNAILLLIALPSLRRLLASLVILVPALFYTESRGAIAAAAIGIAVIVLFQCFRARPIMTRVLPLLLLAVGVFLLMPASLRTRVTTLSAGTNTPAAYSLQIRKQLSKDAHEIIARHRWTGVGIGRYVSADSQSPMPADDPHEVLLLQAAEGGYGLAAAFLVLVLGTAVVLFRSMRRLSLGPVAAAVLIATAAHGLVDVYWVRGTPVLSWLLVGMACGELGRRREGQSA
jgi:hypothetical protein